VPNICWDRGYARKNRLDPQRHIELHYPTAVQYRLLLVGDQGTAELRRGHTIDNPYAVYPTWEYGNQTIVDLERMLAHPGEVQRTSSRPDEQPVEGQEHRVVIIRPPAPGTIQGRAFMRTLADLQFEYPEAIIHYHGTYSYRIAFGHGFRAADIDPVADAAKGRITLASGKRVPWEEASAHRHWVHLHGFALEELSVARNRTMFNIRSAQWAGEHFNENVKFKVCGDTAVDPDAVHHEPVEVVEHRLPKPKPGDKIACDYCSLAPTCRYFRVKGVCSIPDTDGAGLARYFKTRDSDQIIDGLGRILEKQAARFQQGIDEESQSQDGLDPEVTKLGNLLFNNGVKLAKLVDPTLAAAGAPKIGVQINAGVVGHQPVTPASMMAGIVRELEEQGVARHEITAQMVAEYIAAQNRVAIETTAIDQQ
jgi:hypothetical protein